MDSKWFCRTSGCRALKSSEMQFFLCGMLSENVDVWREIDFNHKSVFSL